MHRIDPTSLPWRCAPENFVALLVCEGIPSACSSLKPHSHLVEYFKDGGIFSPPITRFLAVYRLPELQRFLCIGRFLVPSIPGGEALVPPPDVQSSVFSLSPLASCIFFSNSSNWISLNDISSISSSILSYVDAFSISRLFPSPKIFLKLYSISSFIIPPHLISEISGFPLCVLVFESSTLFILDVCSLFLSTR